MQRTLILCASNPISLSPSSLATSCRLTAPFWDHQSPSLLSVSRPQLHLNSIQSNRRAISPLLSTVTQEIVETIKTELRSVEIGYISSVHGLQGEICVKPSTDFPELRFSKPGRRWLRQQVLGTEQIQEIELLEGRGHPGQKCWILRFKGIDTVDQAKQLVGSTLLVREEDRPDLEEGEFYTHDLVGMKVTLKETGELVGIVVNVFNTGGNDLLEVMLDSTMNMPDGGSKPMPPKASSSSPHVWVPFVEAIVPDVDMMKREMKITPPKGLLELNLRSDDRSKKERRQIEWKERKKFQKRLIAAKKKLCEMGQQHVFDGFRYGEKSKRSLLADEIVGVNSKLLQEALENIKIPLKRWNVSDSVIAIRAKLMRNILEVSEDCLIPGVREKKLGSDFSLLEKGICLATKGRVAFVLVVNEYHHHLIDSLNTENSTLLLLQSLLCDKQRFMKIEDCASVPLVLICPAHEIQPMKSLFLENNYFAFDAEKVWFLEEEKLPIISNLPEDQNSYKILMKSPWEMLQSPVGSGGVISLLSSNNILEDLSEMGVEYIEICSTRQRYVGLNLLLLGFVNSRKADIGIRIPGDKEDIEESFDMVLSMNFMKKLTKQIDKLHFSAKPKPISHVEKVDKEWVDVIPSSPNSYELSCSIYGCLDVSSPDKVCVMEVTE